MANEPVITANEPFSFNNFPNELKEKILCSAGPEFHHIFMSVSRDWYHIISHYRKRNKMPHTRKININALYPYSIQYMRWCIKNNLSPEMICKLVIAKGSFNMIKWFTRKYYGILAKEVSYTGFQLPFSEKENIIKIIFQRNDLCIFKWFYEHIIYGKYNDADVEVLNYVKNCAVRQKNVDILRYLLSDPCISFYKWHFRAAILNNFTEGVKLLHKEQYCEGIEMTNLAFENNTNIEIVGWMINKYYHYYDADYREYLLRHS
jgi:uncharacterized membrane protein YbaN (DUF454 family)